MPSRQDEFERVALPHTRALLGFARRLTPDQGTAEDLVQETMLSAWRGFHQFQAGTNVRAWLFRILLNAAHGYVRKMRNTPAMVSFEEPRNQRVISAAADVAEAVERLPEEQRTVLLLGVVEGFTCREMSEILGAPIGTVMSRISRARANLRAQFVAAAKGAS